MQPWRLHEHGERPIERGEVLHGHPFMINLRAEVIIAQRGVGLTRLSTGTHHRHFGRGGGVLHEPGGSQRFGTTIVPYLRAEDP